ncbi:hypothetical protein [Paraglaciecola sp. L3A3]|uniref:hypothetical protein n=1 Tax=Paraglaciecola sp. L3A3 TaxID=2686358 RepID=UPI00131E4E5D|nr:hypothetical protein [Paraglaciecola sp. L3A3]
MNKTALTLFDSGGYQTAAQILNNTLNSPRHKMLTTKGFGSMHLAGQSINYGAIRGREQQLIDYLGGALSIGGSARNKINGIADFNPNRPFYFSDAIAEFGALPDNSPYRLRFGGNYGL